MPSVNIATPASSAPTDRLALGVVLLRQDMASISGTANPSWNSHPCICFEGSDE
ncbi:MAG: hypothetical protein F2675_06765 [Actinobacteria bacterium]|uniref:Unannotated protein n=1 Tax=freshwater metagenome TaxID=449393 RepID=A0A6J6QVF1_9ZZZZ|nr:hypothetical protein [Actinomycetota bacterium]MSY40773.1 hypothetical protein [Actinomycetota bacterium]